MENQCFIDELVLISSARQSISYFDQRLRVWIYANRLLPVHPSQSTWWLISQLNDHWLARLSEHAKTRLEGEG
ncbi:hypothetical protein U2F10_25835 [Leptothoe sp. EHU-05/26/07-4]